MKKYTQLILLVSTVLSILCFVFYKHEYDRLKKVLEVLDFFGSDPGSASPMAPQFSQNPVFNGGPVTLNQDYWHQFDDNLHFYDTIKVTRDKGWSIHSLVVLKKGSQSNRLGRLQCAVVAGDSPSDVFEGTIEWKQLGLGKEADGSASAYAFTCNVPECPGDSHLLILMEKNSPFKMSIPLANRLDSNETNETVVFDDSQRASILCVVSSDPYWKSKDVIQFALYYSVLGIKNFQLYHRGVSQQVISALNSIAIQHKLNVDLLLWNTPSVVAPGSRLDVQLVERHCNQRHLGSTAPSLVVTVRMNHYFVPHKISELTEALVEIRQRADSPCRALLETDTLCSNTLSSDLSILNKWHLKKKQPPGSGRDKVDLFWSDPSQSKDSTHQLEPVIVDAHTARMVVLEYCPLAAVEVLGDDSDHIIDRFTQLMSLASVS